MINDNYGDVVQASFWVNWYHKKGIKIKYVCFKDGVERCLRSLQLRKDELMTVDEFMKIKSIHNKDFVHFYGGGYMNKRWGKNFADFAKKATSLNMKMLATGVQVDKEFIKMTSDIKINYLSVRDRISQDLTGNYALIVDDSFGYFYENRFRYDIFWLLDFFYFQKKVSCCN